MLKIVCIGLFASQLWAAPQMEKISNNQFRYGKSSVSINKISNENQIQKFSSEVSLSQKKIEDGFYFDLSNEQLKTRTFIIFHEGTYQISVITNEALPNWNEIAALVFDQLSSKK